MSATWVGLPPREQNPADAYRRMAKLLPLQLNHGNHLKLFRDTLSSARREVSRVIIARDAVVDPSPSSPSRRTSMH